MACNIWCNEIAPPILGGHLVVVVVSLGDTCPLHLCGDTATPTQGTFKTRGHWDTRTPGTFRNGTPQNRGHCATLMKIYLMNGVLFPSKLNILNI